MSESGLHGEGEFWLEEYGQAKYLGGGDVARYGREAKGLAGSGVQGKHGADFPPHFSLTL